MWEWCDCEGLKMRIAVCDDDKKICAVLKNEISSLVPDAKVDIYYNGIVLLKHDLSADILFLDIEMPGINGIEVAGKLRKEGKDTVIIFISGEEKYVWKAFNVEALQYLRKPFSKKELNDTLQRAVRKCQDLNSDIEEKPSLMVHHKGIHEKVYISEIVYAEAMGRKVILHRVNDSIEYYGKISDLEKILGGDFFRVHRAFLINLNYVVRYEAEGITLKNGHVSISKANYPKFVKRFLQFTAENA